MSEINSNQYNLNAHYSTQAKIEIPERVVVSGPALLPRQHVYNDKDAKRRMRAINEDIYQHSKSVKNNSDKGFIKAFLGIVFVILAALGIKKLFK